MRPEDASSRSTIEAWREQNADALDPWRFCLMDALERRSTNHVGSARQLLDRRLSRLIARYAEDLAAAEPRAADSQSAAAPPAPDRGPLGDLVDHIVSRAPIPREDPAGEAASPPDRMVELPALDDFRKTWSRLRSQSQLQQVDEHAPADAGPLNSATLVHRSLALMRTLSPDYLAHFLSYIDDLSWMEQMAGKAAPAKVTALSRSPRKRSSPKSRPVIRY